MTNTETDHYRGNGHQQRCKTQDKLPGKILPKSRSSYRDVSIERKITIEVTEQHRAMRDEMAKALNSGLYPRVGVPKSSGTVVDVENATVAISAATTEHDSEVFFSHSPPLLRRSL
ncbi:hypothetical protein DEO72_LG1g533 [Vigna unguiculata]|uniref:Uncharacterized protein n=1 Tax=Vigna unguiculata TaxID=3917 RepID=A0A4D6KI40_VIGUN|nr:hypothetical protein DEO72_LG1g533 [Vigna unguiculata]